MKKFEYKKHQLSYELSENELNDLGSFGWELVYYSHDGESIFQREIELIIGKKLEVLNDQFSEEINLENLKKDQ
tara:strand:+ start:460 stop:681 length:222 start_codon:yes stop_codon:yes gene_type:complete